MTNVTKTLTSKKDEMSSLQQLRKALKTNYLEK